MAKNPTSEITGLLGGSSGSVAQVFSATTPGGSNVAVGGGSSTASALTDQLTTIATQLQELQTINQSQMASIEANTSALNTNTSTKGSETPTAESIGSTLLDTLGLGSGLSPLISGLMGLFGGGGSSQTTVTPYLQPLPVNLTAGFTGSAAGAASGVDFGEGSVPRQTTATTAQQQITVQVQAMDSQSFLDRSNDIAAAVRKAMLETSALNDVIREV